MKKISNKIFIFLIIFFLFYFSITGISYALFSTTLNIQGEASTAEISNEETVLPGLEVTPLENGRSFVFTDSGTSDLLKFVSETWDGDNLTVRMKKTGLRWATRTNVYTIIYTNNSVVPWTNGSVTTSTPKSYSQIKSHNASINKTTVEPGGDSVVITVTIGATWFTASGTQQVDTTLKYTVNGVQRTVTISIIYGT